MKVVIPNYAAPDSFVDNVSHTLRAMGHEVHTMPRRSNRWVNHPAVRMSREVWRKLYPNRFTANEQWLLQQVQASAPDMVLCLTQSLQEEVLAETRRLSVPHRVVWWGDPVANMQGMGLMTPEWDRVYIKDPHGVTKLRRLGLNTHLLHEAMNPDWHRPVAQQESDDVVIAGTFYGYRQALTLRLIDEGVTLGLYGGRLPRWANPEIRARHTGRFVVRDEKSRVFGAGLACLNSTSLHEGNSLNCRAFEIAGAGGLHLLEYREIVTECFEPGVEVLTFESVPELLDLLARARREPAWAQGIRDAGARRALTEHTYQHRLDRILSDLAA